jgi:hypothetical protein
LMSASSSRSFAFLSSVVPTITFRLEILIIAVAENHSSS